MIAEKEINIMDLMNTNFYSFWLNEKPHSILSGGRSSMKSSVISLKLVIDFLEDDEGNVVCLRKVAKYLSGSVYEQIKWAIYMLGVQDEFIFGKSPLVIIHKRTKTGFYFHGVDDPQKLKSMNIAKGYYMALWYEELAEFAGIEDIDIVEDTFIRQDLGNKEVKVYYSYNPPRNSFNWVNKWRESKENDDNYFLHHSTYMDDEKGFLSRQMIKKIEQYKRDDYEYWDWMYNGSIVGIKGMVYNPDHFVEVESIPSDDDLILIDIAIDTGYSVSATVFLAFGYTKKRNVYLLDTFYYSPGNKKNKKAPSEFSQSLHEFEKRLTEKYKKYIDVRTIDSADAALRNQYFLDHSIRLHPVAKKKKVDMIDHVIDLLAQKRFFILDNGNNKIFITEHQRYAWDEDTIQSEDPRVIKEDDHSVDAFQYYVMDNLRKLGLKH